MMRDQVALAGREQKTEKEILDQMLDRHGLKVLARTKNK
jgi:cytochrome c-type biogenesis protein CcmH/NrfF